MQFCQAEPYDSFAPEQALYSTLKGWSAPAGAPLHSPSQCIEYHDLDLKGQSTAAELPGEPDRADRATLILPPPPKASPPDFRHIPKSPRSANPLVASPPDFRHIPKPKTSVENGVDDSP